MKNRQWQGEDGNTRYSTEVHVQDFTFLSTKKESMANQQSGGQKPQQDAASNTPSSPKEAPLVRPDQEDDLPF